MTTFSEKSLSQKLQRTEARTIADLIEARKILFPEVGADWIEVEGAYAMCDWAESPLTQTFGLGIFDEITDKDFDKIEAFFKRHKALVFHEISPMVDPSLKPRSRAETLQLKMANIKANRATDSLSNAGNV